MLTSEAPQNLKIWQLFNIKKVKRAAKRIWEGEVYGLFFGFLKARAYKFLEFTIPPLIPNLSLQTEYQDRLIPTVNGMITEAIPLGCFMFKQCVQVSEITAIFPCCTVQGSVLTYKTNNSKV